MKSDNLLPTYHFAHLVDDHLMRTTHVVRGQEWISSVPVHYELFKTFGFKMPKYIHTPLILKKLKFDPAVASGPVIATTIDVIGLAVYLTLVTWYLISV